MSRRDTRRMIGSSPGPTSQTVGGLGSATVEKAIPVVSRAGRLPPTGYAQVLADMKRMIQEARHRALTTVNRELVSLYWHIGRIIARQQETARWGDGVVEQLSSDLRAEFPDMRGLSRDNVFRMRQFFLTCREIDLWLQGNAPAGGKGIAGIEPPSATSSDREVGSVTRQSSHEEAGTTLSPGFERLVFGLSWTHHYVIMGACDRPDERYFYMTVSDREHWSVRELRRQIDAALFERYVSVPSHPQKCLSADAERGDLLPFKDHYVLEFLGLTADHSELELRKAILGNLRNFFLEFGKELTFVGEEYPLTVGGDTFRVDLLFFHRGLQCLIAVDLKKGKFKPEYTGKSRFYCAALDEFIKLPQEKPSLGLILCRSADAIQVRLALTDAAGRIGVATYRTALPDQRLIRQRIATLPAIPEAKEV